MKNLLIIVGLLLPVGTVLAQLPVEVDDRIEHRDYMPTDLMYFSDPEGKIEFDQIIKGTYEKLFERHSSYLNADFIPGAAYWIRLPVRHRSNSTKMWILEFYDQTIDRIDAYIPSENGGYEHREMGDEQAFTDRLIRHKNFEIPLKMQRDTVLIYYFKVRSHEFADIRLAFRSVNYFVYYALNEYFLFGTFYGMILIISLYNFLVYFAIREIKFIYYIFYLLSVALYALSLDGIGFQYLWPSYHSWNQIATGVALFLVIFWALVFTKRFLSLKANAPGLDRLFKYMIIARSALFVFALFFYQPLFSQRALEIIPLSLIFYAAVKVWRNGYRPARFFVVAYGVLFLGFFLRMLVFFNVLPFTIVSHYSLHFSFVLEMLFLTMALGDRIRILKDNKDRALRRIIHQHEVNMQLQSKVNRELEKKVEERTLELNAKNMELEKSNDKLVQQAVEINQINSMLDLDNWKLKNRVKEVLSEMLMEKVMTFEEFSTLYPDSLACYRFLENLKWGSGFTCRKCGNEKYFAGAQKFARRCTRCGYNESVTAFTIFHNLKFPVDKAFFMAYLQVAGKKAGTLEEMASRLDLNINTVWSFRSKVQISLDNLRKKGHRPSASRWEEVIFHEKETQSTVPENESI